MRVGGLAGNAPPNLRREGEEISMGKPTAQVTTDPPSNSGGCSAAIEHARRRNELIEFGSTFERAEAIIARENSATTNREEVPQYGEDAGPNDSAFGSNISAEDMYWN